ncbi:hypothetical protein ACQKRQ_00905 [Paraburkholderia sp. NPDC080076]|uniref:hypothetical protein n=1 Tax=Paraburkholderia sp. NPDC080076 TaxID=3390605 RepID=UPI003D03F92A
MADVLEWLIDISMASASAAATGSIFLLLVGVACETRRHVVKHRDDGRMEKRSAL